jgi:aryl-alcohol dehydrogenase
VPREAPLELLGPLACGIATGAGAIFNTAKPGIGESLVIFGAGAVGQAAVMAAALTAATRIIVIDLHDSRLQLAKELGATHVINAGSQAPVAAAQELCGGPADYSLECTGVISVVRQAVDSVGMLGTCILIGEAPAGAEFSVDHLSTLWGKRIVGILGGSGRRETLIGSPSSSSTPKGVSRSTVSSSSTTWRTSTPRSRTATPAMYSSPCCGCPPRRPSRKGRDVSARHR